MSHYFDEVMHRGSHPHGAQTPAMLSPTAPRLLRRSSTSRSLAARSDFNDVNGGRSSAGSEYDGNGDGDGAQTPGAGDGNGMARRGSVNPALLNDPDRVKARAEADAHLHSYISQQLERVKLERGQEGYEDLRGEEFEAQASS
jgi:hypothetical protein